MYFELRLLMMKENLSLLDLSKTLKISRDTLSKKISGQAKFYIDEICLIRDTYFPNKTIDEICKKS